MVDFWDNRANGCVNSLRVEPDRSEPSEATASLIPIKTNHTFTVVARVPPALESLAAITSNLGWVFDPRVRELFRTIDPDAIDLLGLDPLAVLNRASATRLETLAADPTFVRRADELLAALQAPPAEVPWGRRRDFPLVAYFSPEFGLAASVPQYSGGLGVLAGDHLKAAADLHLPIVGVGLFYRSGYFRQIIDREGRQQERFPWLHPAELALHRVDDIQVSITLAAQMAQASVWRARIGPNDLYLLDTHIPGEHGPDQLVNDRLYGGGSEERIRQEMLLGVGGFRALRALGLDAKVFHLNEGHAGFLTLERIRVAMSEDGLSFDEAVESVRASMLFTTHTPVPAGIDRFPRDLVARYFAWWCAETGVAMDTLLALGSEPAGDPNVFNLAHMSLRLCGDANAVSILHGDVSRSMFSSLWPDFPVDDVPIGAVTNGVHAPTFMADEITQLLDENVGPDWPTAAPERFRAIHASTDAQLWSARNAGRRHLVEFVRARTLATLARRAAMGTNGDDHSWVDDQLDPGVLTIGFARRFATYKRATLLLTDMERLRRLLLGDRPIQLVFAGKAHPADDPGKEFLRSVAHLSANPELRHRVAFVEDYDLDAGRMLTRGVDVWLNTPLRPMEACGTSGMKAALNGVLNLSVRDGWWDEAYRPELGWAIPTTDGLDDAERDRIESGWLYEIIENEVVPKFYERDAAGIPVGWTTAMAACLEHLVPRFHAGRMVRQYAEAHYLPVAERAGELHAADDRSVRELAAWRQRVSAAWAGVRVVSIAPPFDVHANETVQLAAEVQLGSLLPDEVRVEYAVGPVGPDGELTDADFVEMVPAEAPRGPDGTFQYVAPFVCDRPGTMGYAVRVVPFHPALHRWSDLALIRWAD